MNILGLDLSTKTGWSFFKDQKLVDYGLIKVFIEDFNVNDFPNKSSKYTKNLLLAAADLARLIREKTKEIKPDVVVLENSVKGRNRHTQRIIEWIHLSVIKMLIMDKIRFVYLDPSEWRYILAMRLDKNQKKHNRKVSQGKIKGRITPKHLSVALANKVFNLKLKIKDNDLSDSILLAYAAIKANII